MPAEIDPNTSEKETPRQVGRLALWFAGSAVFGSVALVLWNRRALRSLRDAADVPAEPARIRDDDGIY